jgi:hypothetical protein
MTIDEMIAELQRVRAESPLGGETVVVVCLEDSEITDCEPTSVRLDTEPTMGEPNGLAVLLVPFDNHEIR